MQPPPPPNCLELASLLIRPLPLDIKMIWSREGILLHICPSLWKSWDIFEWSLSSEQLFAHLWKLPRPLQFSDEAWSKSGGQAWEMWLVCHQILPLGCHFHFLKLWGRRSAKQTYYQDIAIKWEVVGKLEMRLICHQILPLHSICHLHFQFLNWL